MDGPRDDFFADTALARDEDFGVGSGDSLNFFLQGQDLGTVSY
jgi:hypothetical protein